MKSDQGISAQQIWKQGIINSAPRVLRGIARRARKVHLKTRYVWEMEFLLRQELQHACNHGFLSRDIHIINKHSISYIISNQQAELGVGAFSYKAGGPALCYASCYAALAQHVCGQIEKYSPDQKKSWADLILSYQGDDGLFRDPQINIPLAYEIDWWGWRHLTLHAIMALTALGASIEKPFSLIQAYRKKGYMTEWLESRDWRNDPASVSNEVQNYGMMLQYARDFQGSQWCSDPMLEMFRWLNAHQDPKTGLWGGAFNTPQLLSNGVQTGYHIWLLYFYDNMPVQYIERIIDSCLQTQNPLGGFGPKLNSSACEDIDSIDPLVRLSFFTDYRAHEIRRALERAWLWVVFNQNADGGWVFTRRQAFEYGHPLMRSGKEESAMFPTWFRTLSLAYMDQVLSPKANHSFVWHFLKCPGHQFWKEPRQ
jgi:hypothetical protein